MLAYLTNEHISHVVAEQVRLKRPDIRIESSSVARWHPSQHPDDLVLIAAMEEGLTLVTYDQKKIPPILLELASNGGHHGGVVFADRNSIPSDKVGILIQALIAFYDQYQALDWSDLVMFLQTLPR